MMVFFQAGLYAPRERRAGPGASSLAVLVALIVLAFGIGTGYHFTTTGLIPTAVVTSALSIGLLRAAYESVSLELLRVVGVRRRSCWSATARRLAHLQRQLLRRAAASASTSWASLRSRGQGLPGLGARSTTSRRARAQRPDELILARRDFDEQTVLDVVQLAHRHGVKVKLAPTTTELLVQRGRVRARAGRAAVRAAPPGPVGCRLGVEAELRPRRRRRSLVLGLPLWLLVAARDQARLARAGSLRRPSDRCRRARVRDAQVPHDGRGRRRSAGRARASERGRRARCSRSGTIRASPASAACCAGSRSTSCPSS